MKKLIIIILILLPILSIGQNSNIIRKIRIIKKEQQQLVNNNITYKRNIIYTNKKELFIISLDSINLFKSIEINKFYDIEFINRKETYPYDYKEIISVKKLK